MPLLNHTNVRAQEASEAAVVGTINNGIGNTTHGQAVYITGAETAVDVTQSGGSVATAQNALSTTAEEAFAARSTRRSGIIQNLDATITMYVGANGQVSSTTGARLLAGESMPWYSTRAVWMVAASGTPSAAFIEFFD